MAVPARSPRAMRTVFIAVIVCLALPGAASASGWSSPLAGYWPLNEGWGQVVRDWSGHGSHGQLGSTPGVDANDPAWIRGVFGFGHGLRFGGDDFVAIPSSPSLEPGTITVESWFRRAGSPGPYAYLLSKGGEDCEAASYGLYSSANGGLAFYVYDGTAWTRSPEAQPTVWDGRWHHAAGTFDGGKVRLFVDGTEVGSGTPAGNGIGYDLPEGDGSIGAYRASCSLLFEGDLDGVRIWSRALPVADIWAQARQVLAFLRR
jgi:Concanavalin A-like lectin/glucanases superfamily